MPNVLTSPAAGLNVPSRPIAAAVPSTSAPEPPHMVEAGHALDAAARALLDAAKAYDAAVTDDDGARAFPLDVDHALVALAGAVATDRGDLALVAGRYRTGGRPVHVPTGRQIEADPDALAVHVVGDADARGPNLRLPVDPDALALGPVGLRDRPLDCDLCAAGELRHGPFAELVAVVALGRLDLPLALDAELEAAPTA
ncbi:hypothetical protein [Rubrivirga sp.]|uniref:hypothetical protein n=1 Tax=Rubrivirga sp. TaxID=1885344 RepID=UPI003B51E51C